MKALARDMIVEVDEAWHHEAALSVDDLRAHWNLHLCPGPHEQDLSILDQDSQIAKWLATVAIDHRCTDYGRGLRTGWSGHRQREANRGRRYSNDPEARARLHEGTPIEVQSHLTSGWERAMMGY